MKNRSTILFLALTVLFFTGAGIVFAATGIINNSAKYAWSNNIGWINFAPTDGSSAYVGLTITDSAVTGYAWSQNFGWINFSPTNGGVSNTTAGALSGYAWGQNTGWINFSGVVINCSGKLTGTAAGYPTTDIVGTINFDCTNCNVTTTWTRSSGCTSGGGGGGGGAVVIIPPTPTPTPTPTPPTPTPTPTPPTPTPPTPPTPTPTPTPPTPTPTPTPTPPVSPTPTPGPMPTPGPGPSPSPSPGPSFSFPSIGGGAATVINNVISSSVGLLVDVTQTTTVAVKEVKEIVNTPEGSIITKTISTAGVVGGTVATVSFAVFSPASFFELFLFPFRVLGILLTAFGIKKRRLPWGIAYDSVTKQPLDPAYITLKDVAGKEVASAITDLDGRYGFLVPPGFYYISAKKTNYMFPSQKLSGKSQDELYHNLYFGELIEIKTTGEAITKNIPMDPLKFDWNEFAKRNKNFMKFYTKWDLALRKITDIFFVLGFIVAIIAFFAAPYPYNSVIAVIYLILLLMRVLGLRPKPYGLVSSKVNGDPLSFAIIHVINPSGVEVGRKIADKYGRYYCLVPKGQYSLKIEKKNEDGTYSLVYTSGMINASKTGIIKQQFKI